MLCSFGTDDSYTTWVNSQDCLTVVIICCEAVCRLPGVGYLMGRSQVLTSNNCVLLAKINKRREKITVDIGQYTDIVRIFFKAYLWDLETLE